MLNLLTTRSRSIVWVLSILVAASMCLVVVRNGAAAERKLTRAEMATSFGGDGIGECCFTNPACYYAGTYTQPCSTIPGNVCTGATITKYVGNTQACLTDTGCPKSSCVSGGSTTCSEKHNCVWLPDPITGIFSCEDVNTSNWQPNVNSCTCAVDPAC